MPDIEMILVDFEKYCPLCKHHDKPEVKDPCNDCLAIGAREETAKPEYFVEAE